MSTHDSNGTPSTKQDEISELSRVIKDETGEKYYLFRQSHVTSIGNEPAAIVIMMYLINQARMRILDGKETAKLRKNGGWFCCPMRKMREDLPFGEYRMRDGIHHLVSINYVQIKYDCDNRMWIKVRHEVLRGCPNHHETTVFPEDSEDFKDGIPQRENLVAPPTRKSRCPNEKISTHSKESINESKKKIEEPADAGNPSHKPVGVDSKFTSKKKFKDVLLQEWADSLNSYINKLNNTSKATDGSWWRRLKKELQGTNYITTQIDAVLKFLQDEVPDPSGKRPKPTTPEHFVRSLPVLLRCLNKHKEQEEETSTPSPEVQKTLDIVRDLQWPNHNSFVAAVRMSVKNLHEFSAKVTKLEKRLKEGTIKTLIDQEKRMVELFLMALNSNCLMHHASTVLEEWFRDLHEELLKWKTWDGNVTRYAWDRQNERTQTYLGRLCMKGTGTYDILKLFTGVL